MKVKPLHKLVCRTPAFPINTTLVSALAALKEKIRESSPAFAEFIEPFTAENLDQLDEKTLYTLWKYFNRAKYRSTPFGSFAAVSLLPLAEKDKAKKVVVQQAMECSHFIDWSFKEHYLKIWRKSMEETTFLSNSSIYLTGNEFRYLKINKNVHELVSISAIPEIKTIIETCKYKTKPAVIYELMKAQFGMDLADTKSLLIQLVDLQLLISAQFPNITGNDYFERMQVKAADLPQDYIIAKRKLISGSFDPQLLKAFPQMIDYLTLHLGNFKNNNLERFKLAFLERFEHQEIGLAILMDPEIGIGYGNLAQRYNANILVDELKLAKTTPHSSSISYSSFHAFLLNKIMVGKNIQLEEFTDSSAIAKTATLPNTFSFIFHLFKSKPVIAYAGGCTATALIGRFTMGHQEMEDYAKEISAMEMEANPAIVFFDIAYQAESRVDNVNRRKMIYPFELPILTWSETAEPLDFNDIMVSVYRDEVILRSKKLGKRIMPRIPSAYNYTRSDLAAYRFLCDIQSQGLATQLSLNLSALFPKLQYYPRVNFDQLILSPAMWLVPPSIYNNAKEKINQQIENLTQWFKTVNINFKFKSGYADSTLCFDPNEKEDLIAFLHFCKQQHSDVYLSEALIAAEDCISDEKDQPYLPQYIVNFGHQQTLYPSIKLYQQRNLKEDRIQLPGGEWLYFELYSHSLKCNTILLQQVQQFIKVQGKFFTKWFFVRYSQPSHHLRLRIRLKNKENGFHLIAALKSLIEPEIQLGSITDFKIKTYFRETHRYGAKRMHLVEQFFMVDSKCVLFLLTKAKSEEQLLSSSLKLILRWLGNWMPRPIDQLNFVNAMADNFAAEMQIGTVHFKKINANFNQLKDQFQTFAILVPKAILNAYLSSTTAILTTCDEANEKAKLIADLIHMHINRLFSTDQRMYETIIYHYLLRTLQIKRALSKTQAELEPQQ